MEASGAFQCPRSPWPGHSCSTQKSPGALRPDFELRLHGGPQRKPMEEPPPPGAGWGPGTRAVHAAGAPENASPWSKAPSAPTRTQPELTTTVSAPGSEGQQPSLAPGPRHGVGRSAFPGWPCPPVPAPTDAGPHSPSLASRPPLLPRHIQAALLPFPCRSSCGHVQPRVVQDRLSSEGP